MNNFFHMLKYELTICHRSYHLLRHSAYIMLLSSIILSIMLSTETSNSYTKMILIIFGSVISAVTIPSYLIKTDMQDGSLENMLVTLSPSTIIMTKYCSLVLSIGSGIFCILPIIILFYGLKLGNIFFLLLTIMLILLQVIAIVILGNIIHAYFRQNTNLILAIIIPLIIPPLIFASMAVKTFNIDFLFILMGIDMIFVPIFLMLSSYLCASLYEF